MKNIVRFVTVLLLCTMKGYSQPVQPGDIVINEILFNPVKDGFDYLEGYNAGNKTINLEEVLVANRNITGDIASIKPVTREPVYVLPGGYFIFTANERWLRQEYSVGAGAIVCQLSSLPSFPDDEGCAILLSKDTNIIDELRYSAKWHFSLVTDHSGIALERINYNTLSQDKNNWTSASSSSGFGTPGLENSQFRADLRAEGEIIVSPAIFSPDNDGVDDYGWITYNMKEQGYMANCIIYDVSGRRMRYLLKNELLGIKGRYKWDGLNDVSGSLPQGIYILCTEIFNLSGKTKKFKHSIVLARRSQN